MLKRIEKIVIAGGGSAGFMAAVALKIKMPWLSVTVVRSPDIGIIGVGEGSTPAFVRFIHEFLGISYSEFVRATRPGIKTGTCFIWGPKPRFFFPFGFHMSLKLIELSRPIGYYLDFGDSEAGTPNSARMQANRAFYFDNQGALQLANDFAYHVDNERFAAFLENKARAAGVLIIDGNIEQVRQDESGITSLGLADGRSVIGDLFIDCSGFRSLLLGKTLEEPRVEYKTTLACDRAVVGSWDRPAGAPILSYTIAETMDAGWCWRIEHPEKITRGYVYSSSFISDEAAERELRTKNPSIGPTRIVKFISGRFARSWVKNVVAIGNAGGFVEPLEATSLALIASRCQLLVELLHDSDRVQSPPVARMFNDNTASIWDSIRDFLSLHYRFNTRLDTPFWQDRRANTDLANAQPLLEYYQQIGPSPLMVSSFVGKAAVFEANSFLAILAGQKVPAFHDHSPPAAELAIWSHWCRNNAVTAQKAATVEQSLSLLAIDKVNKVT